MPETTAFRRPARSAGRALRLGAAFLCALLLAAGAAPRTLAAPPGGYRMLTQSGVAVRMRDGVLVSVRVYRPATAGRFPALLAASPYRYDNDGASPSFIWNETGPIAFYVAHGYAYVRLDVRGTGRSGGTYDFFGPKEQHDLYDVIEWIARQPWSNGNVGGIGQSYYAMSQWFMAEQRPPHLRCIAPYDGNVDVYRDSEYQGGIHSGYWENWYEGTTQGLNLHPFDGAPGRLLTRDLALELNEHSTYDAWWQARTAFEHLDRISVPVYSIGIWGKLELHLPGNILGFQLARGPKKLLLTDARNSAAAHHDYTTAAFHQRVLLPFYDWCLKGDRTEYLQRPAVAYAVRNAEPGAADRSATAWPPPEARTTTYALGAGPSGSVVSLNDGALVRGSATSGSVTLRYPNPGWTSGVVGPGPDGKPDPVRRILTFTSAPLEHDVTLAGPSEVLLYLSSSQPDPYVFVKLSDQRPRTAADRTDALNPPDTIVTKGWLRAAFRDRDSRFSTPLAPFYDFGRLRRFVPGRIVEIAVPLVSMAYRFPRGDRIRVEIANGDSSVTDPGQYVHPYLPSQHGADTIWFGAQHPSRLELATLPATAAP